MPYDPHAPTESERSGMYISVWIGFAASVVLLSHSIGLAGRQVGGFAALVIGAHLVVLTVGSRFDEHFVALRNFGFACAMSVIGLWLAARGLVTVFEVSHDAGQALAEGVRGTADAAAVPRWLSQAEPMVSLAGIAFYIGFAAAYWRGSR